jgi:hypothetical protein
MRDYYQRTQFDVTKHPVFNPGGKKNPLAHPFGSRDLFDLVGVKPERCIATETSGYVYISQIRDWLPDPTSGCMWFTLGPSFTSCFAPVYSDVTELAESWSCSPNFTRIERLTLFHSLIGWTFLSGLTISRPLLKHAQSFLRKLFFGERLMNMNWTQGKLGWRLYLYGIRHDSKGR